VILILPKLFRSDNIINKSDNTKKKKQIGLFFEMVAATDPKIEAYQNHNFITFPQYPFRCHE